MIKNIEMLYFLFSVLTVSEEKWIYCLSREESVEIDTDKSLPGDPRLLCSLTLE